VVAALNLLEGQVEILHQHLLQRWEDQVRRLLVEQALQVHPPIVMAVVVAVGIMAVVVAVMEDILLILLALVVQAADTAVVVVVDLISPAQILLE
jgi:hypothetical protein